MFFRSIQLFFIAALVFAGSTVLYAQAADGRTSLDPDKTPREAPPKNIQEMMDKMRIEKEKKDHEEMIERGDEALKISDELETSLEKTGKLTEKDLAKLASLEKLVKKIRSDLGGGDDDDTAEEEKADNDKPSTIVDGFRKLKTATVGLVDELKKTTRFSISAAAIYSSNSVIRLTRFLRFWR